MDTSDNTVNMPGLIGVAMMAAGEANRRKNNNTNTLPLLMALANGNPNNIPVNGSSNLPGLLGSMNMTGDNVGNIMQAIGKFESGNNYGSIGPLTGGDHAYGAYQVMGNNIPAWSKEALGYSVTPQQFLNSPAIQDQVAHYKMGQYYDKYGNVNDVASMWFSGRPASGNNSKDVLGTSVPQYIANVNRYYYGT